MRTDGCDQRSLTMYRLSSGTGRDVSSTSRVGPRLVSTQAANSAALAMVADNPTSWMWRGAWMMISSHTGPRARSWR